MHDDLNRVVAKSVPEIGKRIRIRLEARTALRLFLREDHQGYVGKGEFRVHYSSLLMISKLAPLYYLQHEFQVDNRDDEMLSPTLDGFDIQPYTKSQAEIELIIQEVFSREGYEKLSYSQMNEVLPEINFGEDVKFFGSQVTVEYVVFHDVLGICPE